jgi:transcriptional regulator with XRE-family HTH domain
MSSRDPGRNPRQVFGAMVRFYRERAGVSRSDLARQICKSESLVQAIELGQRAATPQVTDDLEVALSAGGVLAKLRDEMGNGLSYQAFPSWFQDWANKEAEATTLRWFEPLIVPGLLQTEDYARAVIRAGMVNSPAEDIERRVSLLMARQPAVVRDDPPKVWAVLDEAALRRRVGGSGLMRLQLEHLLAQAALPNVAVQVIPFAGGAHPAMGRPFIILVFPERVDTDVVYLEDLTSALYLEDVAEVDRYNVFFNHLRATALSFDDSAALITSVLKEM